MTTADGTIQGTTKIVDNGSPSVRFNVVIVGDGYRATEMVQYADDVQQFVDTMFGTPPFDGLRRGINIYRVDVTSTDSGADDPATCTGGLGTTARTYFDATFCGDGRIRRLLTVNGTTVLDTVGAQVPEWNTVLVVVNSTIYGGSGGTVGTFSLAANAEQIALHELGHTAFGLADEYEYWAGCGVDTDRNNHPAVEPAEVNVTTNIDRATLKWGHLVAATTPIPTTRNADCTQCDPQASPVPAGTVGLFEGAHYYHCGAFRPEFNCKMRALGNPFCAVCQERIRAVLGPYLTLTGTGEFYLTNGAGNLSLLRNHYGWRQSWTHIIPGYFTGGVFGAPTALLFYEQSTGTGEFYSTDGWGNISLLRNHTGWRQSWTHIVPGEFGPPGWTDLLFYEQSTGTGEFYTTDGSGNISLLRNHTGWRQTWKDIIPGNFGGGLLGGWTDLLFYETGISP